MERGSRWTLVVVGLAVGMGFGLVQVVERASSPEVAVPASELGPAAQALPHRRALQDVPAGGPPYAPGFGSPARYPLAPYHAYGSLGEGAQDWPAAPQRAYPSHPGYPHWRGTPDPYYGGPWQGAGEYDGGYRAYPPPAYPPDPAQDAAGWWAPEHQDGPPPPAAHELADPAGLVAERGTTAGGPAADRGPAAGGAGAPALLAPALTVPPGAPPETALQPPEAPAVWGAGAPLAAQGAGGGGGDGSVEADEAGPPPVAPFAESAVETKAAPPNP